LNLSVSNVAEVGPVDEGLPPMAVVARRPYIDVARVADKKKASSPRPRAGPLL
jgi:hypothetical protein